MIKRYCDICGINKIDTGDNALIAGKGLLPVFYITDAHPDVRVHRFIDMSMKSADGMQKM